MFDFKGRGITCLGVLFLLFPPHFLCYLFSAVLLKCKIRDWLVELPYLNQSWTVTCDISCSGDGKRRRLGTLSFFVLAGFALECY